MSVLALMAIFVTILATDPCLRGCTVLCINTYRVTNPVRCLTLSILVIYLLPYTRANEAPYPTLYFTLLYTTLLYFNFNIAEYPTSSAD